MDPLAGLLDRSDIPEDARQLIRGCLASVDERRGVRLVDIVAGLDSLIFELSPSGVFKAHYHGARESDLYASPEEFIGKHFSEVLPPDVAELVEDALAGLNATGLPQEFEYPLDLPTGRRWFRARVVALDDGAAEERRLVVAVREIAPRADSGEWPSTGMVRPEVRDESEAERLAEENARLRAEIRRLRRDEAEALAAGDFLENILESVSDGVFVTDAHDTVTYVNSSLAQILRVGKERLLGAVMGPQVQPAGLGALAGHYKQARDEAEAVSFSDLIAERGDGQERYLAGSMVPFITDGRFGGVVCSLQDVTRRRRDALRLQSQGDLARAVLEAETLDQALSLCLETALRISQFDCGAIYSTDEASSKPVLRAFRSLRDECRDALWRAALSQWSAPRFVAGEPVYITAGSTESSELHDLAGPNCEALAIIPIRYHGQVVACMVCAAATCQRLGSSRQRAFGVIASQVGATIARFGAEESLRAAEERYRLAIEATNDGIWDMQTEPWRVYWSPQVWEMLGHSFGSILEAREHWAELVHPDDLKHSEALGREAFEGKRTDLEFTFRGYTPEGEERYIHARARAVRPNGPNGGVRIVGSNMDITERVRAERALEQSRQLYRATIDALDDMVHVMDADFRVLLVNDTYHRWREEFDLPCREPEGEHIMTLFPFATDQILEEYHAVFRTGEACRTAEEIQRQGRAIPTETYKLPVVEEGRVARVVTLVRRFDLHAPEPRA
ncbi:MAG: PAS domain S-box protein [candidate division WS1 bacterium]|nr:PAS domain S-box protein [candidate division WS1 bacterium]